MKKVIICLIFFLANQDLYSQNFSTEWTKRKFMNVSVRPQITVDNSGNVYLATSVKANFGSFGDVTLTKYNSLGDSLWSDKFPNLFTFGFEDKPVAVSTDDSGYVYLLAEISNIGSNGGHKDILLAKYNTSGTKLWHKFFNTSMEIDEFPTAFAIDKNSNIYICGKRTLVSTGDFNILLIKYNLNGELVWNKSYGDSTSFLFNDFASDIELDRNGNIFVTGSKYIGEDSKSDYITLKYDSSGALIWDRTYNGTGTDTDEAYALTLDSSSNVYVTGVSSGGANRFDIATIKYNNNGIEQWVRTYNGLNFDDAGRYIESDKNGNIFVGGNTQVELFGKNVFTVLNYSESGILQWERKNVSTSAGNNNINGIRIDKNKNLIVGATIFNGNTIKNDRLLIQYNSNGDSLWSNLYDTVNTDNTMTGIFIDNENNLYSVGEDVINPNHFATVSKFKGISPAPKKPVFIVPGVGATYAANISYDMGWMLKRGIEPDSIQIDPLAKVYHDLIITLQNNGYVLNKDLFVVNYDWRLQPGPVDNAIDGHINGLTASGISDNQYLYAVDYLGWYIKKATDRWRTDNNEELDSIDIICHSTGGLVSRTYIQSDAYGGVYDNVNNYRLPKVRNLVMLGVPSRGASKPWNVLQDNWSGDVAYRFVLSKLINRAFQKVMQGFTITGLDHNITKASILDKDGNPDKKLFIYRYVPTLRYLVSTYPFLDFGNGLETINNDPELRNTILLDLNNGADINAANDPNGFADSCLVSVIYSSFQETGIHSKFRDDYEFNAIHPFTNFIPRNSIPPETWFQDISFPSNGDGTVPAISAAGQFLSDTRTNIYQYSNTDHTAMVAKKEVQAKVLEILNIPVDSSSISTGNGVSAGTILSVIADPVEIVVTDGLGRRLGFIESSGSLTEIPNSSWFGNADGIGYVFGDIVEPLSVTLTGLGENYYVMVSYEDSLNKEGGVVMEGFLENGEEITYQITLAQLQKFDAGITSIVTPSENQILENSGNPVSVYVKNFGSTVINNCNLFYKFNNITHGPVKVSSPLNPGDSALVTFKNAYRLKSQNDVINGNLEIFIGDTDDTATANNSISRVVSLIKPVTDYPYTQKFNSIKNNPVNGDTSIFKTNTVLNPSGINNDSALKSDFFNSSSGTSILYTPILNLDSLENPVMSFYMAYTSTLAMENDRLEILISKNGGLAVDTLIYGRDFSSSPSLATTPVQNNEFTPSSVLQWRNVILNLKHYSGENIVIGLKAISSGGNNLWIDDLKIEDVNKLTTINVNGTGLYGNLDTNLLQINITGFNTFDSPQLSSKSISGFTTNLRSSTGELIFTQTDTVPENENVNVNATATSHSGAIFTPDYLFNRYWNVSYSGDDYNSMAVYDLIINVSEYAGDMDPGRLYILKRKSETDNWECVSTVTEFDGINPISIKATGLQGFGQFAIASDESSLPVELISFSSLVERNNVTLNWTTATEINNSSFEIERKASNQTEWIKTGSVNGYGNTTEPKNYSYIETNLNTGKYKYRLKQIDYNGNFEYYDLTNEVIIGVPEKFDLSQNYPNPFNPVTKINYDLPFDSKVQMKIYDITGREVFTLVNEQQVAGYYTTQFNASTLASGVYFYRIVSIGTGGQEFVMTKKMMLVK